MIEKLKLSDILKEVRISNLPPPSLIRANDYGIANITIDEIRVMVVALENNYDIQLTANSELGIAFDDIKREKDIAIKSLEDRLAKARDFLEDLKHRPYVPPWLIKGLEKALGIVGEARGG